MSHRKSAWLTLILTLSLAATGCALKGKEGTAPAAPAKAPDVAAGPKVAVFVDGAFGDRNFFDLALKGAKRLETELGATVTTYEGQLKPENFQPQMRDAAQRHQLVFVLGYNGIDAMLKTAQQSPQTQFVFIDAPIDDPAITSVVYRDEEGCYLAGALAAEMTTLPSVPGMNEKKVVGFVGGMDAPVIRRCEAGFAQGVKKAHADVAVESLFVGSFSDPAKGKEANSILVERGSDINFEYAGLSGEGGFQLAKSAPGLYLIGNTSDQTYLAPGKVLGNMLKNVDESMVRITTLYKNGSLKRGEKYYGGLKDRQLGLQMNDLVPADVQKRLQALQKQIEDGSITVVDKTP